MSAKLSSKNFYGGNLMVKCFVALVIFFCSVGNLFAQTETKVTINVDKVLIRTALERLQKETKVHFVYDEENIDQDKRVSLSYTQAPLKIVLEDFCKQTSLRYEVKRNLILILPGKADRNVNRQSFLMKGVVTDEDGESIIGATVMIGGTSKGTVTDINGQYTLEVQSGDLVSFTFVGMTDKVIKAQVNKKMVNVQLESNATALADVVITGYQTLSKERATGSFDKVDSSVLSSRPTADLSTALQGLVAGMQATEKEDGSIDFLIRGSSSLYADKKPLLVVDGFPIQGDFSSINPNDVESVTVLKDAAAASIWGARSANGVIVVTTKKGKKDKVQVDVQAFVRIGTNPDLEYIMNQADSRTMVDYEMRAFENNWKMAAWEYAPTFSKIQNSLTLAQELYYANKYQGLSKEEMEQGLERLRNTSNRHFIVFRNQLNYNNSFAEKHEISALAGIEISQYDTEGTVNPYVYGYNKEKNTSSVPPYGYGSNVDSFKNFFGNSATIEGGNTSYSLRCDRYVSYYTNIGYVYDGKYGASFSARGDGSNFVSDDPSLRWSPMWSVGAKWNIGKEEFIKDIDWINYLNLRATYGINGNAEKSTSPLTLVSVGSSVNSTTGTITGNISSFGNPSLRWEKTYTTNIGVDFDLFRSKLSGKLDFYNRKSKDVIGQVTIPSVYGTSTQKFNNAEILNRGVELELTGNFHIPSVDLGIRSTVTYAYNYNKILKLYYPALYCYELVEADTHVEGRPVGSLYSYDFLGTENGIPYVIGANGDKISMNDVSVHNRSLGLDILHYSGTTIPPHTFGWSNQFTWNNFSLYVYLTGNFGGIFRAPTAGSIPSVGSGKTFVSSSIKDFADSDGTLYPTWPLKDESNFYLWDRYTPNLEYFVQDASFIRLKEINLEYNLSKKLAGKLHLRGAKLFVQARNLGLIYCANDYGYDPEWLPGSNKPSATIAFGANINF